MPEVARPREVAAAPRRLFARGHPRPQRGEHCWDAVTAHAVDDPAQAHPTQALHRAVLGRVMRGMVEIAPQRGRLIDQLDIKIRVQLAERWRDKVHHVEMASR